ncbi:MAG: hypothetical protein Q9175_001193 [Cornicularia normoerica]
MSAGVLDPMGGEITYTPTTHRISKAKKGKKVHACEYPGCTKKDAESLFNVRTCWQGTWKDSEWISSAQKISCNIQ